MGAPQSPSATPTFPATITPPADGDALSAPTLNTNVETPLQDGVEAARLLTYAGGIRRNVKCTSSTAMVIQPMRAVIATRAPVIAACRRSALLLRAGRPGAQTAVLSELQQLAVAEVARPALQGVLRWARGEAPYMNRALNVPK